MSPVTFPVSDPNPLDFPDPLILEYLDEVTYTDDTHSSKKNVNTTEQTVITGNRLTRYYDTNFPNGVFCNPFHEVTLHFDGISMICYGHVLENSCSRFEFLWLDNLYGDDGPRECTIEGYSEKAVMTMLWHIYVAGDAFANLGDSYKTLSRDEMISSGSVLPSLRHCFEVFRIASEFELPELRSQAQANIMTIRRRAMELKDFFFTSQVLSDVLCTYEKDSRLDSGMFDELASQLLEYECLEEDHHFWMFRKIDGVWGTEDERYQRLVEKLNELDDTGMVPRPIYRSPPKSEEDMWTW
jgi:hypothetical protein